MGISLTLRLMMMTRMVERGADTREKKPQCCDHGCVCFLQVLIFNRT